VIGDVVEVERVDDVPYGRIKQLGNLECRHRLPFPH
jgi:hypothetical protein